MSITMHRTENRVRPLTVRGLTDAYSTMQYAHFVNPCNPDEVIINYDGIAIVVNRRVWNMEGLDAPVLTVRDIREIPAMPSNIA